MALQVAKGYAFVAVRCRMQPGLTSKRKSNIKATADAREIRINFFKTAYCFYNNQTVRSLSFSYFCRAAQVYPELGEGTRYLKLKFY